MRTIPRILRTAAAVVLITPALAVALGQPATAGPNSCMSEVELSAGSPAGGESCMGGDPADARNGTCALHSLLACRD